MRLETEYFGKFLIKNKKIRFTYKDLIRNI